MKIKNAVLSLFIIFSLISPTFTAIFPLSHTPPINTSDLINGGWPDVDTIINSTHARGESASLEYIGGGKYVYKTELTWIWDDNNAQYTSYIFEDKYDSDGYYEVRAGLIGARIYDYYTTFYNPNMTEIRVHDERFELQRWREQGQGSWNDIGVQSGTPTFNIVYNNQFINIEKCFNSWAGLFCINYKFSEGDSLKHTIIFDSIIPEETYQLLQQWSGIVGDKVRHKGGLTVVTEENTINSTRFDFLKSDGSLSVRENQDSAAQWLGPTKIDTHAQGMKATFTFGNFTISQGGSFEIDPATITKRVTASSDDVAYRGNPELYSLTYIEWAVGSVNAGNNDWRQAARFLSITIPAGSTINSAYLTLTIKVNRGSGDWKSILRAEDVDDAATFTTKANYLGRTKTGNSTNWDAAIAGWGVDSVHQSPDMGSSIQEVIDRPGWASGQDVVVFHDDRGSVGFNFISAWTWDSSAAKAPLIEINYMPPNEPPTSDAVTITNFDDGDNIYPQRGYIVTLNSSDEDGGATIQNISMGFTDGVTSFNMTADTSGAAVSVSIISGVGTWRLFSASNVTSGDTQNVTFTFSYNWNATDAANIELNMRTCDSIECSDWEEKRTNYADMETDLTQANFALNDDRGNPSATLTATWTNTYEGSAIKPPDGNFTTGCIVHNPAHATQGTAKTPVAGVCTINDITASAAVGNITYHPYMNGGGQYPDGDVGTKTDWYVSDKKNITITIGASPIDVGVNASISVSAVNVFDNSVSDSTLNLNDTVFVSFIPIIKGFTVSSVSPDGTYGITTINVNDAGSVEWEITIGELRSVESFVSNDTTTNTVYEDVNDLSINITIPAQADILIMASIQTEANISAVASYRLVFDGVNYQGLTRQVGTLAGNMVLSDLVHDKAPGNYELKLQHNVSAGQLSTINTTIYAVHLHNGNGPMPSNDSFTASDSIVGIGSAEIVGLSTEITLHRTSHVWMSLTWAGEFSINNRQGNFTIEINGLNMETRFRNWPNANEFGALSLITRTNSKLPNGTYTVKGLWQGSAAGVLTGMNFSLVVFGGEANGTVAEIEIQKIVNEEDTTVANSFENIDNLTLNFTTPDTSHVMGFLTFDSLVNVINKDIYHTININLTNHELMKRGHPQPNIGLGSIGQVVRTNNTLPLGTGNMTGRWHTDPATTATGMNIILVSLVLFSEDSGLAHLTIIFHTGISQVLVGGASKANLSVTAVTVGDTVNITSVVSSGFTFYRYDISPFGNHTHASQYDQTMNQDVTAESFALAIPSVSNAGLGYLVIAVSAGFLFMLFLVTRRKK